MKQKVLYLFASCLFVFGFLLPVTVGAVNVFEEACSGNDDATACEGQGSQTTQRNNIYGENGVLTKAATLIASIVGIAAVVVITIGGFKYIMSSGDANSVKSAKDTIVFAAVGLVVAASIQGIVLFVLRRL